MVTAILAIAIAIVSAFGVIIASKFQWRGWFMNCFRCDGTGKVKNEFGIMEKCESCQGADMTFEKIDTEPDEEGYWKKENKN